MRLTVERDRYNKKQTMGRLSVDGKFVCYTLEDPVRERPNTPVDQWKVHGDTAIPVGVYRVVVSLSSRFQKFLPELLNVPGYRGVRMHSGNTEADTEGCILLGDVRFLTYIGSSRTAVARVQGMIEAALSKGDAVEIEIR